MDALRDQALGDEWRKLVADGVTATPVSVRRGPAVKVVNRTVVGALVVLPDR